MNNLKLKLLSWVCRWSLVELVDMVLTPETLDAEIKGVLDEMVKLNSQYQHRRAQLRTYHAILKCIKQERAAARKVRGQEVSDG